MARACGVLARPDAALGDLPLFAPFVHVQHAMRAMAADQLPTRGGPASAIHNALALQHPDASPPRMDPLLRRCLSAALEHGRSISSIRLRRLGLWCRIATECENGKEAWLARLPEHAAIVYRRSKLKGPLLGRARSYLVSLGFSDVALFEDISKGFLSWGCDSANRSVASA